ncbi:DUF7079 family protein [Pseudomonas batumici]|uniref:DUF7079 family protein n=1 Tax=Pseudomonas batumici TaxID=226910 RepID=UPI001FD8267C|nr:hypothetical protein [Pseudomonas batumici]
MSTEFIRQHLKHIPPLQEPSVNAVDANRLKIWQALSSLFLDTEIDGSTFDYVAHVVLESGYSPKEVHNILWGEVFPVLEGNLKSVAGEWVGWPDDWLLEHLTVINEPEATNGDSCLVKEIARCWERVAARLPSAYA